MQICTEKSKADRKQEHPEKYRMISEYSFDGASLIMTYPFSVKPVKLSLLIQGLQRNIEPALKILAALFKDQAIIGAHHLTAGSQAAYAILLKHGLRALLRADPVIVSAVPYALEHIPVGGYPDKLLGKSVSVKPDKGGYSRIIEVGDGISLLSSVYYIIKLTGRDGKDMLLILMGKSRLIACHHIDASVGKRRKGRLSVKKLQPDIHVHLIRKLVQKLHIIALICVSSILPGKGL